MPRLTPTQSLPSAASDGEPPPWQHASQGRSPGPNDAFRQTWMAAPPSVPQGPSYGGPIGGWAVPPHPAREARWITVGRVAVTCWTGCIMIPFGLFGFLLGIFALPELANAGLRRENLWVVPTLLLLGALISGIVLLLRGLWRARRWAAWGLGTLHSGIVCVSLPTLWMAASLDRWRSGVILPTAALGLLIVVLPALLSGATIIYLIMAGRNAHPHPSHPPS